MIVWKNNKEDKKLIIDPSSINAAISAIDPNLLWNPLAPIPDKGPL